MPSPLGFSLHNLSPAPVHILYSCSYLVPSCDACDFSYTFAFYALHVRSVFMLLHLTSVSFFLFGSNSLRASCSIFFTPPTHPTWLNWKSQDSTWITNSSSCLDTSSKTDQDHITSQTFILPGIQLSEVNQILIIEWVQSVILPISSTSAIPEHCCPLHCEPLGPIQYNQITFHPLVEKKTLQRNIMTKFYQNIQWSWRQTLSICL